MKVKVIFKGGPGSGHHGHAGRPGKRGGSLPGKGGSGGGDGKDSSKKPASVSDSVIQFNSDEQDDGEYSFAAHLEGWGHDPEEVISYVNSEMENYWEEPFKLDRNMLDLVEDDDGTTIVTGYGRIVGDFRTRQDLADAGAEWLGTSTTRIDGRSAATLGVGPWTQGEFRKFKFKVGDYLDFYEPTQGDKKTGTVTDIDFNRGTYTMKWQPERYSSKYTTYEFQFMPGS